MVVYDWRYFECFPNNTNIDLCTFAVKQNKNILEYVDKTIINQVIENAGLKGDYSIIKSGDRDEIIKLIKAKYSDFCWCVRLIKQDEDIINCLVRKDCGYHLKYVDWSLVFSFRDKSVISNKFTKNISYLKNVDKRFVVRIINDFNLLQIHPSLNFIIHNDLCKFNNLIKTEFRTYGWGIRFINQNEKSLVNVLKHFHTNFIGIFPMQYINIKTNLVYLTAIKFNYTNIIGIEKQNTVIKLYATRRNADSLRYIKKQHIELCIRNCYYSNILLPKYAKK